MTTQATICIPGYLLVSFALVGLLLGGQACEEGLEERPCSAGEDAAVLVIGDSIMATGVEECSSIPDALGRSLDLGVRNNSVGGTMVTQGEESIPEQYEPGDWEWVVVDGGGNDLNERCGCGDCGAVLDELASDDGRDGKMAELIDRIRADGPRVVLVGYYTLPDGAEFGFDRCDDLIGVLNTRYKQLAEGREDVFFVDPGEVVSPELTPDAYGEDRVHPSFEGAMRIAEHIAASVSDAL